MAGVLGSYNGKGQVVTERKENEEEEREYRVRWEIDVTASSPREAAQMAKEIQEGIIEWGNTATVFDVTEWRGGKRKTVTIDLLEDRPGNGEEIVLTVPAPSGRTERT